MIFDKIKELLGGSIAENIPGADALGSLTEQLGPLGEQASTLGEQAGALGENAISDSAAGLIETIEGISPLK